MAYCACTEVKEGVRSSGCSIFVFIHTKSSYPPLCTFVPDILQIPRREHEHGGHPFSGLLNLSHITHATGNRCIMGQEERQIGGHWLHVGFPEKFKLSNVPILWQAERVKDRTPQIATTGASTSAVSTSIGISNGALVAILQFARLPNRESLIVMMVLVWLGFKNVNRVDGHAILLTVAPHRFRTMRFKKTLTSVCIQAEKQSPTHTNVGKFEADSQNTRFFMLLRCVYKKEYRHKV